MNELTLRKHVSTLIRKLLNYPHPEELPEEIRKARNAVLKEATAEIPAKIKEAVTEAAKELLSEAPPALEDSSARPPKILETEPPGDEP